MKLGFQPIIVALPVVWLLLVSGKSFGAIAGPTGLRAEGHDSRVDLIWDRVSDTDEDHFHVYRAEQAEGPWKKLTAEPQSIHVYSDFIGANDRTYYYRVTSWIFDETRRRFGRRQRRFDPTTPGRESVPSAIVRATTRKMNDEEFLDSMQQACFRYFWDFGHPVSGLAREGFRHRRSVVTSGGTGFGMITIMVGADRGFVTRQQAATRLLKMVRFLEEKAERFHGLWSHHLRGDTGETLRFAGREDNGADIVESAFLMQGMLTVREYFDGNGPVESELRKRITRLWQEAEWNWHLQPGDTVLTWHWSPDYGFAKNHKVRGFDECMIAYLLAMASPTHPIPAACYYRGWIGNAERYVNGSTYYGIKQPVGPRLGGPLFFTHYSFIGLDPRQITDAYANYYDNNRAISLVHHRYAIDNPNQHEGYGRLIWGLTASRNPDGYRAHRPGNPDLDDGTIAPTAAISAFPYTPVESMATLKHLYHELGAKLWGPFGFYDAFNPGADWVSSRYLAIDQGPMAPMIENHRTGMPWKMFMESDVGRDILAKLKEAQPADRRP
jgi:exo beta-1,2-glucooligosaccharide sophorohydrolase (non-reducing end)